MCNNLCVLVISKEKINFLLFITDKLVNQSYVNKPTDIQSVHLKSIKMGEWNEYQLILILSLPKSSGYSFANIFVVLPVYMYMMQIFCIPYMCMQVCCIE